MTSIESVDYYISISPPSPRYLAYKEKKVCIDFMVTPCMEVSMYRWLALLFWPVARQHIIEKRPGPVTHGHSAPQ